MAKAKGTKQTSVAPTTATSCQLTGSDIASMSFPDLDSLVKAGCDRLVLHRTETKKIRETLVPVIVRVHELLSDQGKRTDLADAPTWEKWMERHKSLGSPRTFYRLLAKAKVIPLQPGDVVTTPDKNEAKIVHLHSMGINKVDVEEMLPNTDQPVLRTYNLDELTPITPKPYYCATTPDKWDLDVAKSAAHKSVRRGDEANGVYWIKQLYFTKAEGRSNVNVWKQLFIYACEEIGLADLSVKTHILDLYKKRKQHLEELEEIAEMCKDGARHSDLLMVVEAMILCCRAEKSRAVDDAILYFNEHPTYRPPTEDEIKLAVQTKQPKPTIPDNDPIYDQHTRRGRKMRRGLDHFKAEGACLENKSAVADFQPPVVDPEKPFPTEGGL
jgi:hypothetical protein